MGKNRIFLGGTCNNSVWREELISLIRVDYFNPVVEDWTPECQMVEMEEKESKCNIHLYVITSAMVGVFSIAEVIDSVHNASVRTLLQVIPTGFERPQLKSLEAVVDLVNYRGGVAFLNNGLKKMARTINSAFEVDHG